MRVHYNRKHTGIRVFEKRGVMSRKEINKRHREKVKMKKEDNEKTKREQNLKNRDYFDEDDARKQGIFLYITSKRSVISLGDSCIKKAGKGVYADTDFKVGDIITKYEGRVQKLRPRDRLKLNYTYQLRSGNYLVGIDVPKVNKGLGSFVNRPDRGGVANVCFLETGQEVFIEAKREIKKGDELLCHYGRGYII